jgi:signal peptidase II
MKGVRRVVLIVFVMISCVGCDQVSKTIARRNLTETETASFLGDFLRLKYTENPGAFFSLGANTSAEFKYWVFIILVGLCLAGMLVFLLASKKISMAQTMALSLLVGGGVSNWIDRIGNEGRVIDFMNFGIGSLRSGVFNVADVAIFVGSIWLLTHAIKSPEKVP